MAVSEATSLSRTGTAGLAVAAKVGPVGVDRTTDGQATAEVLTHFEAQGGGASVGRHAGQIFGVVRVVGRQVATIKVAIDNNGGLGISANRGQCSQGKTLLILINDSRR